MTKRSASAKLTIDKFLKIAATIWLLEEAITSAIHFILWRFVE